MLISIYTGCRPAELVDASRNRSAVRGKFGVDASVLQCMSEDSDDTLPSLKELLQPHLGKRAESETSTPKTDLPETNELVQAIASDYMEETQSTPLNQDQRGNSQGKPIMFLIIQGVLTCIDDPLVIDDEPYSECYDTEDEDEDINTTQGDQNEPLRSQSPYYDTAPQPKIELLSTNGLFNISIALAST